MCELELVVKTTYHFAYYSWKGVHAHLLDGYESLDSLKGVKESRVCT